jgi:hypothetical protein
MVHYSLVSTSRSSSSAHSLGIPGSSPGLYFCGVAVSESMDSVWCHDDHQRHELRTQQSNKGNPLPGTAQYSTAQYTVVCINIAVHIMVYNYYNII